MFRSAVFYQQAAHKDFVYEINDIYKYRCKNGIWTRKRFFFYGEKNKQIGALLKTIDFLMRQKYEFKSTLKTGKTTKLILNIANKEIDKYLETKKRNSLPKIEIDVSKLQTIRTAALETQTKLIVDEDREEPAFPEPAAVQRPQALEPHVLEPEEEDITITGIESRFLKCLLYGKAYDELIRANGLMLSVLVDTVNEKLYDRFSDTVIIFTGDKPELIDDYIDELKGIFSE